MKRNKISWNNIPVPSPIQKVATFLVNTGVMSLIWILVGTVILAWPIRTVLVTWMTQPTITAEVVDVDVSNRRAFGERFTHVDVSYSYHGTTYKGRLDTTNQVEGRLKQISIKVDPEQPHRISAAPNLYDILTIMSISLIAFGFIAIGFFTLRSHERKPLRRKKPSVSKNSKKR